MFRILYVPTGEFLPIAEFNAGNGKHYFEYTNKVTEGFNSREFAESMIQSILEAWERVTIKDHPEFMPNEDGAFLMGYCYPVVEHYGTIEIGAVLERESFEIVEI